MINPTEGSRDDSEDNYGRHAAVLVSQVSKGDIGSNTECAHYPCHHPGQNCTFCFCPLYPCLDPELGMHVTSKRTGGQVWSCQGCLWMHRDDVVGSLLKMMPEVGPCGLDEGTRSSLKADLESRYRKKAKAIMVLGGTSGAGKSLIVAALCRAFRNRGLKVAPFKSQNMSLNSMVTSDGDEIARIQDLQARAAGTRPRGELNPILLKPKGGVTSQVIVEGRPYKDCTVQEYYSDFVPNEAPEIISRNLERILRTNDVVVIEGAGSPAEINLRGRDVANMYVAKLAKADCLLAVNIDWGGAYAYSVGTLMLLEEEERKLFKGVLINNMCPGGGSLGGSLDLVRDLTGVPVLAVLPHVPSLYLPVEDSMDLDQRDDGEGTTAVAVVRLPMISNFTDFDALSLEEGVKVIYARTPEELVSADAIILPGTKNTVQDLLWLRQSGMAAAILGKAGAVPILGICGGYQMLGRRIFDVHGLEGSGPSEMEGLGLLDAVTHFDSYDKRTVQVQGTLANGGEVRGYEIHMGRTESAESPLCHLHPDGRQEGSWNPGRKVMGTYMHGVFDLPAFRGFFLSMTDRREGIRTSVMDHDSEIDSSLDRLAAMVEEHLDLDALLRGDGDGA